MAKLAPNMSVRSMWMPQDCQQRLLAIEVKSKMLLDVALVTMAEIIEQRTYPYVPYELGYLEGGFEFNMLSGAPLGEGILSYSAIDNDGYDYALIQHYGDFHHPKRKPGKKPSRLYLSMGLIEAEPLFPQVVADKLKIGLM